MEKHNSNSQTETLHEKFKKQHATINNDDNILNNLDSINTENKLATQNRDDRYKLILHDHLGENGIKILATQGFLFILALVVVVASVLCYLLGNSFDSYTKIYQGGTYVRIM